MPGEASCVSAANSFQIFSSFVLFMAFITQMQKFNTILSNCLKIWRWNISRHFDEELKSPIKHSFLKNTYQLGSPGSLVSSWAETWVFAFGEQHSMKLPFYWWVGQTNISISQFLVKTPFFQWTLHSNLTVIHPEIWAGISDQPFFVAHFMLILFF